MTDDFYATLPRRRMGAGVLFVDADERPLLVEPTYKPEWEIPGGIVEAGEDPRTCAVREVREELALDVSLGRLLVIDHTSAPPPRGDSTMLVYDCGIQIDPETILLAADELRSFRFVPDSCLEQFVSHRFAIRIRHALRARREGATVEIVNGQVV